VLYQALTGRPPFAERRDMQALSHAICHEEPPPPTSIDRQLDRDIDAIVARAMAKAPERRYQSVDALAADVRRHLAGEPIEARRDSAWYLLRKNLWRYRVPVGVGVAVTTLLAVAAGVAWTLYLRAEEFGSATAAAETRAREQLRESLLAQARMSRQTRNMGRRFDALKALGKAARISPSAELRDEALAALARFDVRVAWQWDNPGDRPPATFDPDLKTVAIGHQDGSFVLLRAADRAEVGRLEGNGLPVGWFSFSPDGETFAARLAQDTQVRIWNVRDGRVLHDLQSGGVAFSLDSSRCAYVSNDGSMHLLELSTGREAATFDPPPELTFGGFHPAGDRIALFSRSGGDITIIDLATRATVGTLPNTERLTFGLWSDDGELFAAGGVNGHVYTWNALTGQRLAEGLKHQGDVGFMWFNHAGTLLVSYGLESWTRFWDPHTGEALLAIPGVVPRVFSRDDRFLGYRSRAGDIGVWEIAHDDVFSRIHGDFDQTGGDLTRDGRYMFVSGSRAVRVCDLAEHREVARLPIGPTCNVRLHPDGTRLFTSGDIGIHEWPLGFGDDAVTIGPPNTLFADSGCNGMSLSADGRLLAAVVQSDGVDGSEPSEAIVLDTREPRGPRRFGPHERMNHAVLSSDGRWLATATWKGRGVKVWDVDSGQLAAEFPATPTVSANRTEEDTAHLKFSPDGRWLLVITIAACAFHEVGTWERVWSIPTGVVSDTPANAAFRADGAVLAFTPTPHTVQLFDVEARRPLATLSPPDPTFIHAGYPLYSTSPNR
jgi:WD40 repeat protein